MREAILDVIYEDMTLDALEDEVCELLNVKRMSGMELKHGIKRLLSEEGRLDGWKQWLVYKTTYPGILDVDYSRSRKI